jgi:hypothetical protein
MPAYYKIQVRRGTTAEWTAANPVLAIGEPGFDTDLKRLKFGNGTSTWAQLNFIDVGPPQVVSGGLIANLTSQQQAAITTGTVVTDTNGVRWVYSGTGSKTSDTSYVELADITPTWNSIADKPADFPPSSHTHGNITNAGAIGSTANLPLITTTSGVITAGAFGTTANSFCEGNDARLSDSRTPTAHTHVASDVTSGTFDVARIPTGTTSTTVALGDHAHGNITSLGAIGSTANLPLITTTSGAITVGSFGTAANSFCEGNDARLSDARTPTAHTHAWTDITSGIPTTLAGFGITDAVESNDARLTDARTPTAHKTTHAIGGTDALSASDIGAAAASHTHGNLSNDGKIGSTANLPIITGTDGLVQAGAFGTAANSFCEGNDSRLSDSRTPTAHASTHQTGGTDVIANVVVSPAQITANTDDYAIGTGDIFRLNADAARNITGIVAGSSGQGIMLINVGSHAITLKHNDAGSAAGNKFLVPSAGDYVLSESGGAAVLIYDATTAAWRVV